MEKNLKILTLVAAASLTGSLIAEDVDVDTYGGYAILSGTEKTYVQSGSSTLKFDGGQLTFVLRDGYAVLASCIYDPAFVPIPPVLNCTLGTTGFVAAGDYDGDGAPDPLTYYSFSSVANAQLIEPGYPGKLALIAAPPSKLKRPLSAFGEYSVQVFYNTNDTNNLIGYDITRYRGIAGVNREDNALRQYTASQEDLMQKELVQGVYIYSLPRYGRPDISANAQFTQYPMLEAYSTKYRQRAGLRLTNLLWATSGDAMLDPRIVKTLKWVGPTKANTYATDESYIRLITDDTNNLATFREYPGNGSRANTLSPYLTAYDLAPGFFTPGDEGVLMLEYQRSLDEGLFTDRSSRKINVNFKMVDSYDGFVSAKLLTTGLISNVKDAAAAVDTDGDGVSNGLEFATQGISEEGIANSARVNFVSLYSAVSGVSVGTLTAETSTSNHHRFYRMYTYNNGKAPYASATANDPLTTPVAENALDKTVVPDIVGPYLDSNNHLVLEVPVRPLMGDSCTFTLQALTGFKKGKPIYKSLGKLTGKYNLTEDTTTTGTLSRKLVVWTYDSLFDAYYGSNDSEAANFSPPDYTATYWANTYRPTVDVPYTVTKKIYTSVNPYTGTGTPVTWKQYWTNLNDGNTANDPVSAADCPLIGVAVTFKSH